MTKQIALLLCISCLHLERHNTTRYLSISSQLTNQLDSSGMLLPRKQLVDTGRKKSFRAISSSVHFSLRISIQPAEKPPGNAACKASTERLERKRHETSDDACGCRVIRWSHLVAWWKQRKSTAQRDPVCAIRLWACKAEGYCLSGELEKRAK